MAGMVGGSPKRSSPGRSASAGTGLVVAVVGSDGSGKSTLCRDLTAHYGAVGPATLVYFGSGDGASSWLRWPLVQLRRLLPASMSSAGARAARVELHASTDEAGGPPTDPVESEETEAPSSGPSDSGPTGSSTRPPLLAAARVVWALTLAWEKRGKLRRADRSRRRGRVVICDRYPQAEIGGIMDGPLLHTWTDDPSPVRRAVARWEAKPYRAADRTPPDLVLRLVVDQQTAISRRPEHDAADLRRRREIVARLRFDGARCGIVDLDATKPADAVLNDAVRTIDECRARMAGGSPAG
jgi:thymidylate kinase